MKQGDVATVSFSGTQLAEAKIAQIRARVQGLALRCYVVRDAGNGSAAAYAARLSQLAPRAGIALTQIGYDQLDGLSAGPARDPVLFLEPAPDHIDVQGWRNRLGPARDAEGLHPLNVGKCALGEGGIAPPTAQAAYLVAQHLVGSLIGKKVAIVGASVVVGQPLAVMMMRAGATVCVAQKATQDLAAQTRDADVVIVAAGVPNLIGAAHIREGAYVIDVGVTRVGDDLVGDADRAALQGIAAVVTAVPDGVGPLTAACLFENLARLT